MPNDLFRLFPIEGAKILLVLFLSFLIGLDEKNARPIQSGIPLAVFAHSR